MTPTRELLFILGMSGLAACGTGASTVDLEDRVKQATVDAVPGSSAGVIVVSDIERVGGKIMWAAVVNGKTYACDADDQVRLPDCRPSG